MLSLVADVEESGHALVIEIARPSHLICTGGALALQEALMLFAKADQLATTLGLPFEAQQAQNCIVQWKCEPRKQLND